MKRDYRQRSREAELIDDAGLGREVLDRVHRDLDLVNRWLGGYAASIDAIERLLGHRRRLRILDVGGGGGGVARSLLAWAGRRRIAVEVVLVDRSAGAVARARELLRGCGGFEAVQADVLALPFPPCTFDVAHCSLFLHHFSPDEGRRIIAALSNVAEAVVINDLHRHPLAYWGFVAFSRALGLSREVRHDGPVSVLRAFRRADLLQLAPHAEIRWCWAFRWQLVLRSR
jgi:SAM-dependent methyltransferase